MRIWQRIGDLHLLLTSAQATTCVAHIGLASDTPVTLMQKSTASCMRYGLQNWRLCPALSRACLCGAKDPEGYMNAGCVLSISGDSRHCEENGSVP
jgi:hypothetical protein